MKYGLIGEKLGHSFSKDIHEMLANYTYEICPLSREEFAEFMEKKEFNAINVTIPYKEAVIPYLDHVDEVARAVGAVNTVVNRNGELWGYNTDFAGFAYLLGRHRIDLKDKSVLILGAGGTSKTASTVASTMGAREIIISDREAREGVISYEEAQNITQAEVIINATPNGMYPNNFDDPLVDITKYPNLQAVVDVVYNPLRTNLVLAAEKMGLPACGGLEMLVAQAKYAAEHFIDANIDDMEIVRITALLLSQKRNIALIGMPGSGKTTVAKLLAAHFNQPLIDCDELVVQRTGKSIKEIFETQGEEVFRTLETLTIKFECREGGKIISTGGGAVLREDNVQALRQNSIIVFLDKAVDGLAIDTSRPLSPDAAANLKLYADRYRKYMAAADIKVKNNGTAEEAAEKIIKVLEGK